MRLSFLETYLEIVKKGHYCVFTDETWVFKKGTGKRRSWENDDVRSCASRDSSLGERYVVVGAGRSEGWIPNSTKVFPTKSKPLPGDDYHSDVTGSMWMTWVSKDLVPNLPKKKCAIFLDNAAYHRLQAIPYLLF